jgi:hypothetical protein
MTTTKNVETFYEKVKKEIANNEKLVYLCDRSKTFKFFWFYEKEKIKKQAVTFLNEKNYNVNEYAPDLTSNLFTNEYSVRISIRNEFIDWCIENKLDLESNISATFKKLKIQGLYAIISRIGSVRYCKLMSENRNTIIRNYNKPILKVTDFIKLFEEYLSHLDWTSELTDEHGKAILNMESRLKLNDLNKWEVIKALK